MKRIFILTLCLSVFSAIALKAQAPKTAAILIFDGVQIIDYTGPYEVLGYGFKVITVSPKPGIITTNMGMKVTPDYTIDNCPPIDILVLPGGKGLAKDPSPQTELINWIKRRAVTAEVVMSVCNGAFFLQKAGLLDGLEATTTASYIDSLQSLLPTSRVVRNKRYVDNGKIITTAGLSSGFDGAMHVAAKLISPGWEPVFARWLEYNWDPNSTYTAGSLADANVIELMRFLYASDADAITYVGDKDKWHTEFVVRSAGSANDLFAQMNKEIVSREKWTSVKSDPLKRLSTWTFTGKDKKQWSGQLQVDPNAKAGESEVFISIKRI